MSGGQIKNNQISASSMQDSQAVPFAGRLNAVAVRKSGGWVAGVNDSNQWLQVLSVLLISVGCLADKVSRGGDIMHKVLYTLLYCAIP